jgi:hypothetical protein
MKAGIAVDDWKLPIFEAHLSGAGFTFTAGNGLTAGTRMLTVITDDMAGLEIVVRAANAEAALRKKA